MEPARIGLIGLGTMGAMLSLNIADNGFRIAVFNRTTSKTHDFMEMAGPLAERIVPTETLKKFVKSIAKPRAIILMLPAGETIDSQIAALRPLLDPEDLVIDAGNANFRDTERRSKAAREAGEPFLGIGVSGGEEGARFGPAIMGGGEQKHWDQVKDVLEAISAKYEGAPCATYFGPGGAGHYVKTIHNGIEYADMQIIAEAYGVMRDGWKIPASECGEIFAKWNQGLLKSYLVEISGKIGAATDPDSKAPMLDIIMDRAGQKGTGRWTVIEAQHLGAPITVIDAAVAARNTSALKPARVTGEEAFGASPDTLGKDRISQDQLEKALIAGKVICYAQGFDLLAAAGPAFDWPPLNLASIAQVWREGCIIRSAMLNDMASALDGAADRSLMHAPHFTAILKDTVPSLRHTCLLYTSPSPRDS